MKYFFVDNRQTTTIIAVKCSVEDIMSESISYFDGKNIIIAASQNIISLASQDISNLSS